MKEVTLDDIEFDFEALNIFWELRNIIISPPTPMRRTDNSNITFYKIGLQRDKLKLSIVYKVDSSEPKLKYRMYLTQVWTSGDFGTALTTHYNQDALDMINQV